jgi:hypothetical protein
MAANMDLIRGIIEDFHKVRKKLGMICFQHVDGHQDEDNKVVSGVAALNVEADRLATVGLSKSSVKEIQFETDKAMLTINNKKVCSHYTNHLRDAYSSMES